MKMRKILEHQKNRFEPPSRDSVTEKSVASTVITKKSLNRVKP